MTKSEHPELLYGDEVIVTSVPFKGARGTVVDPSYHGMILVHLNSGRVVFPGGKDSDSRDYVDHRFTFTRDELHQESRSILHEMEPYHRKALLGR